MEQALFPVAGTMISCSERFGKTIFWVAFLKGETFPLSTPPVADGGGAS
jgi:hypothetical protein